MTSFVRLGDYATKIGSGQTPFGGYRAYAASGIPFIRSQNVLMGTFTTVGLAYISPQIDDGMRGSRVERNDVLLNITGASIGRVCVVPTDLCPANVNQHVCIIRCNESLHPEYVATMLSSPDFQKLIWQDQAGATRQALTKDAIEAFQIPWRSLGEQRRIATHLKAQLAEVEAARQAAQAQVRDAGLLRTKIVDAAFGGLLEWRPIAEVAKVQSGYAFKSEDFQTSGVRLLRNTNILPGKIYWDDVVCLDEGEAGRYPGYALEEGDVLISLDRPLISSGIKVARVRAVDLPSLLLQRVGRFVLKPGAVDPDFLYAFLQSSRFIGAISGHDQSLGVPHISPGQVESVELPLLSLDEQQQLASCLKTQLAEAAAIHQAAVAQLAEIERLPQRLLARAFDPSTTQGHVT